MIFISEQCCKMFNSNFVRLVAFSRTKYVYKIQVNPRPDLRVPANNMSTDVENQNKETFRAFLPIVINTIISNTNVSKEPYCSSRLRKMLEYNLTGSNTLRGEMTVTAYETIENPDNVTDESLTKARTLGWCTEILHACILILKDMKDGSTSRNNKPCWHTLPEVGRGAIPDVQMMQGSLFQILKENNSKRYSKIINLFNEEILYTSIGRHVDHTLAQRFKQDYHSLTIPMEQYISTAKYKAGYTFKLPVLLGYQLADKSEIDTKDLVKTVADLCLDMGVLYQMQKDIQACYGDSKGSTGNDIEEGRFTWLSVQALRLCSAEQRVGFLSNYGDRDLARVHAVRSLYDQLNLPQLYNEEERNLSDTILSKASTLPDDERQLIFQLMRTNFGRELYWDKFRF